MGEQQQSSPNPFIILPVGRWFYPVGIIVNYAHLGRSLSSSNLYLIQYEYGGKVPEIDNQTFDPKSITITFIGVDLHQDLNTDDPAKVFTAVVDVLKQIQELEKNPSTWIAK